MPAIEINDPLLAEAVATFRAKAEAAVAAQAISQEDAELPLTLPDPASPVTADVTQKLNRALRLYSRRWREALSLGEACPAGWKFCPEDGACIPDGQSCGGIMDFAEVLAYVEAAAGQYFDLAITDNQRDITRRLFLETLATFEESLAATPQA